MPVTKRPRYPGLAGHIQVNYCKVPTCPNYGAWPSTENQQGKHKVGGAKDSYKKSGMGRDVPGLLCKVCRQSFTIKSNQGIYEELERLKAYLEPRPFVSCPHPDCMNHQVPIKGNRLYYQSYGSSPSGYPKYRCKSCKRTFTVGTPTRRQKKPHLNIEVFRCLVNKMPLRCIMDKLGISSSTLYGKIDFLHQQALAFVANRERRLPGMVIDELQVSVDRQEYVVNWTNQFDKRNTRLVALGSADNLTGYVFGMHLNFDSSLDPTEIELDAIERGDYSEPKPFRHYARLWLKKDYAESTSKSRQRKDNGLHAGEVNDELDKQDGTTRLPISGMQVHAEYTMFGHFFLLQQMFESVRKLTFYMDKEAGIQGACNSAFYHEIQDSRCHAFLVKIQKEMTVNQRRLIIKEARRHLDYLSGHHDPTSVGISHEDIALMQIEEQIRKLRHYYKSHLGKSVNWDEHWLAHPLPRMNEPGRQMHYITESAFELNEDELARLFFQASLGGIDRFFMQVRRKLSLMERPIGTSSNVGRTWYGYSPYNPRIIQKVLDIYRVYYNYVKPGDDKKTPAMRLGLAKSSIRMEDVLYYR